MNHDKLNRLLEKEEERQLMAEIAQLNREFEREEAACKFAREKATNVYEFMRLRQCYLDAAEELEGSGEPTPALPMDGASVSGALPGQSHKPTALFWWLALGIALSLVAIGSVLA